VEDIRPAYAAITVIEKALARYKKVREKLLDDDGQGPIKFPVPKFSDK
jgi:hypothetical protein